MCLFNVKTKTPKGPPPIKPLKDTNKDLTDGSSTRDQDDVTSVEYGSSVKKGSQAQAQGADALRIPVNMPGQGGRQGGINNPGAP